MLDIFVDADACPVKQETSRVAQRYGLKVIFVSNSWMRTPQHPGSSLMVVEGEPEAADDWIVEHILEGDIVITTDVPLASRCIKNGARALRPKGDPFTEANIGDALANRDLLSKLRESGLVTGGPAPFQKRDRSLFLQSLDQIVQELRREGQSGGSPDRA